MAEEVGLDINDDEYNEAQALSKEASKASQKKDKLDVVKLDVHDIASLEKVYKLPKTDDSPKFRKSCV
jgi:alanyl-tRNA synthetase